MGGMTFGLTALALVAGQQVLAMPKQVQGYFPPAMVHKRFSCFTGKPWISISESGWYGGQLQAAGEPVLWKPTAGKPAAEILRFTWLPSFEKPIFVRLEKDDRGGFELHARELTGAGGYDPGEVGRRVDRALTPDEVQRLNAVRAKTHIFSLSSVNCELGCDGAEWIFERVANRRYHFLKRWSPETGPVRRLGVFLIGLTGWRVKIDQ